MTTPRRQLPSVITFGVSATAATVSPLTSVPSTSPLLTLKTSDDVAAVVGGAERQRCGAGADHVARAGFEVRAVEVPGHVASL